MPSDLNHETQPNVQLEPHCQVSLVGDWLGTLGRPCHDLFRAAPHLCVTAFLLLMVLAGLPLMWDRSHSTQHSDLRNLVQRRMASETLTDRHALSLGCRWYQSPR